MAETDTFAHHLDTASRTKAAVQALLSEERAQKYDLLNHLINNLQQSLVICGPEGIGKTTLLEYLLQNKPDTWLVYSLKGSAQLGIDRVKAELIQFIQRSHFGTTGQAVDDILSAAEIQNQKFVFIIDDAGLLPPGVIDSLCEFASAHASLRLIFALTPDELHIKNSSDKAVSDCHFIDLPPLTELQCGGFLRRLAGKSGAALPVDEISSPMIKNIYRESHGIPGKIISMQKGQIKIPMPENQQWLYALAAGVFIAAIISFFLWGEDSAQQEPQIAKQTNQITEEPETETLAQDAGNLEKNSRITNIETIVPPDDPILANADVLATSEQQSTGLETVVEETIELAENDFHPSEQDTLKLGNLVTPAEDLEFLKENQDKSPEQTSPNSNQETANPNINDKTALKDSERPSSQPIKPEQTQTVSPASEIEQEKKAVENEIKPLTDEQIKSQLAEEKQISRELAFRNPVPKAEILASESKQPEKVQKPKEEINQTNDAKPSASEKPRQTTKTVEKVEPKQKLAASESEKPKSAARTIIKQPKPKKATESNIKVTQGTKWVLSQNPGNYSLQLMAVVKDQKSALLKTINKYPELKEKFHYFPSTKKGKEWFVLLYGNFSTLDEAKKAAKKLPKKFAKPWLRSFKLLHKEIKAKN